MFYTHYQAQNLQRLLHHKLSKLRQIGSISSYIDEFNKIMNQIRSMSEEDKIEYFVSGLKQETSNKVAYEEPGSLVQAKAIATKVETYFARGSGRKETDDAQKCSNVLNNQRNYASKGEGKNPWDSQGTGGGLRESLRKLVINFDDKSK